VTNDRPRRYPYAVALTKVKGGWKVDIAIEKPSRAEADKTSLWLLGQYGDAGSITLERELVSGEVLDAAALKR